MSDTVSDRCDHTTPDYFGRCGLCHERIETPSRWMQDKAREMGGSIVSLTKEYIVQPGGSLAPKPPTSAAKNSDRAGVPPESHE